MSKKHQNHSGANRTHRKAEHARKKAARKSLNQKKRHTTEIPRLKAGTKISGGRRVGGSIIPKGGW